MRSTRPCTRLQTKDSSKKTNLTINCVKCLLLLFSWLQVLKKKLTPGFTSLRHILHTLLSKKALFSFLMKRMIAVMISPSFIIPLALTYEKVFRVILLFSNHPGPSHASVQKVNGRVLRSKMTRSNKVGDSRPFLPQDAFFFVIFLKKIWRHPSSTA